jgi:hypothetical protein
MDPTPQTPPEPLAAGELSDEQLLQIGCKELGWPVNQFHLRNPRNLWIDGNGLQLLAALRAAIAADRARHPQAEQMAEALRRLRRWGGLMPHRRESCGYACDVVLDVCDWIDAGMTGPLPPLPEDIARQKVQP